MFFFDEDEFEELGEVEEQGVEDALLAEWDTELDNRLTVFRFASLVETDDYDN